MKKLIIEMMLDFAKDYNPQLLNELNQNNKIQVLNTMVYIAIYQKFAQSHIYEPEKIREYFEFDEQEFYSFNISCFWLKKFKIIDEEHEWIIELLPIDKTYIYTIVIDRNDIGNSTIEIFTLADDTALSSSERSLTFMPKQIPNLIVESVKPKPTILAKPKNRNRIIKKKNDNLDFDR